MKRPIKFLNFSFFILLIVTLFIACDKDFANIDSDVLGDENANFNPKDTILPVAAYSKKLEGLQIDNLASNLLGFFYDPSYGNTTASIITQLVPSSFSPSFGENP